MWVSPLHLITVTLAYSRTKNYFYAYYILNILTGMVCGGSVQCLALAYVVNTLKHPLVSQVLEDSGEI